MRPLSSKSFRCLAASWVAGLLLVVVLGCASPEPPKPVNVTLAPGALYHNRSLDQGDTVVVVRCRGADEYAKTSRGTKWEDHWYLVTMDVLQVERGMWAEKDVKFVYVDSWPTPESGIMLGKAPFPFGPGYVYALALNTSKMPAVIVGAGRRSYAAPYGLLKDAFLWNSPKDLAEYERIVHAVMIYEVQSKIPAQKAVTDTVEDVGDAFIVHRRTGCGTHSGSWLYRVDKKTFALQAVP